MYLLHPQPNALEETWHHAKDVPFLSIDHPLCSWLQLDVSSSKGNLFQEVLSKEVTKGAGGGPLKSEGH
jgi:hypothetical protein